MSETAKSQCQSILIFHCSLAIPTAISQTKDVLFIMDWLGRCYAFMMPDVDLLIVPSTLPDFAVSTMQVVEISMWHVSELFLPCTSIVNTYVIDVIYSVFVSVIREKFVLNKYVSLHFNYNEWQCNSLRNVVEADRLTLFIPQDETGIYKNLLQETAHRAGLKLPIYTTIRSGPGHTPVFTCTVELAGKTFTGNPGKTKKQAQKNAAMAAWSELKQREYHFIRYQLEFLDAY